MSDMEKSKQLPQVGRPRAEIIAELDWMYEESMKEGWGRAIQGSRDVHEVGEYAYLKFVAENSFRAMKPGNFLNKIEYEVLDMCMGLFNSPEKPGANFTSGGSESNFSAIHAIREWAREHKPHIKSPEVIVPYSAHPTFTKGCHYFGLTEVRTQLGNDLRASPENIAKAITPNTVAIVGSAPCWPYGLFDPIEELGKIAEKHGLWLHVDACVGGFLSPFVERLGVAVPKWDFRVPAVQSISADLHKYGWCLKPASTIIWRSEELKKYHYVHPSEWPCGPYRMEGFAGSRTAGPIFAAWAILQYLGIEGFTNVAKEILRLKQRIADGVAKIDGLECWDNDLMPVCIGYPESDLGIVKAEMSKRKWVLLGCATPPLINIPLDAATDDALVDRFLSDLAEAVELAKSGSIETRESLRY
jgi:sphinganine-1-phosphate aldolase